MEYIAHQLRPVRKPWPTGILLGVVVKKKIQSFCDVRGIPKRNLRDATEVITHLLNHKPAMKLVIIELHVFSV